MTTTHHAAAATADHATVRGVWLDARQHAQLLAALTTAAHRTSGGLDCADCDQTTCTRLDHAESAETIRQWRGLAQQLAGPSHRRTAGAAGRRLPPGRGPRVAGGLGRRGAGYLR